MHLSTVHLGWVVTHGCPQISSLAVRRCFMHVKLSSVLAAHITIWRQLILWKCWHVKECGNSNSHSVGYIVWLLWCTASPQCSPSAEIVKRYLAEKNWVPKNSDKVCDSYNHFPLQRPSYTFVAYGYHHMCSTTYHSAT